MWRLFLVEIFRTPESKKTALLLLLFLDREWSVMQDSNLRPLGPKPSALPSCANHRHINQSKMGWLMGLEPTTTGITIRDSTN